MPKKTLGRCPDCGESVAVTLNPGRPGTIALHGCRSRLCEEPGCAVKGFPEAMVRVESGSWYCPTHALCLAARDLVALYRAEGNADWTAIAEIIGEVLPAILQKLVSRPSLT
jgi:hypothetical protein